MKPNRTAVVGAACALGCGLCVALYMNGVQAQVDEARAEMLARYGGEQIEVCVAQRDLAPGEVVDESAIDQKMWVADLLPEDAITDPQRIVGQRLGSSVLKGEVLSARRTTFDESALNIPAGKVAISVPARAVQTVGGSIEPGMSVDLYATGAVSTVRLVEGALVLASSANESDISQSSAWVTLALDPDRVQEVISAVQNLELYFSLPAASQPPHPEANPEKQDTGSDFPASGFSQETVDSNIAPSSDPFAGAADILPPEDAAVSSSDSPDLQIP